MDLKGAIVKGWSWAGCDPSEVIEVNCFGNVIFTDRLGCYWRIMPEEPSIRRIATDRSCYVVLRNDEEFDVDWRMEHLCEMAHSALGDLAPGSSYCLKMPAVLGHAYSVENMATIGTEELIEFSGEIARQIDGIPDGTPVTIVIR